MYHTYIEDPETGKIKIMYYAYLFGGQINVNFMINLYGLPYDISN